MEDTYSHRKQKAIVRFLHNGRPVVNEIIRITQKRHQFLFGCGAFETINRTLPGSEQERNLYKTVQTEQECDFYRERMQMWLELFNYATLPFYWGKYEPEEGKTIADQVKEAALWLKQQGVTIKGHPLCWHTNSAQWLLNYDLDEIIHRQKERVFREVADFKGLIDMWDVINEVVIMPDFDRYDNPVTRICRKMGQIGIVDAMFAQARMANPEGTFLINDFNTSSKYEKLIGDCLDAGVKIDAIGIQSHQHQGYWGQEKLYDVLERFGKFGLPIHFTENTFTSGHLMPQRIVDLNDYTISSWPSTQEGQQRQCENIEEFYRILFACPNVEAITTWSFHDGAWLGAPAGLVTVENKKKPSFYTLKHLIKEEWWTDVQLATNSYGCLELYGFRGDYVACVQGKTVEFSLQSGTEITLDVS